MKNHCIIKIKAIFLILFSLACYGCKNNIEDSKKYYIFKSTTEHQVVPEIDFSKNSPVNQLKLEEIPVSFSKIENAILTSGYIESNKDASIVHKRYEIETNSYGINKIFFYSQGVELPEISSTVYSTGENLKYQRKIVIYLGNDFDKSTGKYKKINLNPEVPIIYAKVLGLNETDSKKVYEKLLHEHIADIENGINKYGVFLVTNRIKLADYWFEFNTEQTHNNTAFYIYKTKGTPRVNATE